MRLAECGHQECGADDSETWALAITAQILGDDKLHRVCERGGGRKPDFRSDLHAVEIKQLTSRELRHFAASLDKRSRFYGSDLLKRTWFVMPNTSGIAQRFDPPEPKDAPAFNCLAENLFPLLERLEAEGADTPGHWPLSEVPLAQRWELRAQIDSLLGGPPNTCQVMSDGHYEGPGVLLAGYGLVNSEPPHIDQSVAGVVQSYLDSDASKKLRESFVNERKEIVRVAVLIACDDGPARSVIRSLSEDDHDAVPTVPLQLGAELDRVVVVTDNHAIEYSDETNWRRHNADRK